MTDLRNRVNFKFFNFFFDIGSFYHSPRVKQLGFTVFESIQLIFWIFGRISVTRQFLVSLTSIVYIFFLLWNSIYYSSKYQKIG